MLILNGSVLYDKTTQEAAAILNTLAGNQEFTCVSRVDPVWKDRATGHRNYGLSRHVVFGDTGSGTLKNVGI